MADRNEPLQLRLQRIKTCPMDQKVFTAVGFGLIPNASAQVDMSTHCEIKMFVVPTYRPWQASSSCSLLACYSCASCEGMIGPMGSQQHGHFTAWSFYC